MTEQSIDDQSVNTADSSKSDEYYKDYLQSLFGESVAEYFLSSSYLPRDTPAWYTELKNNMKDHVSAEALWDALRQRSAEIMKEMESKPSQQMDRMLVDWKKLKRQNHLQKLSALRFMFHSAQYNQAYTALLLQHRPLSLLYNPDMTEPPSQYLSVENKLLAE